MRQAGGSSGSGTEPPADDGGGGSLISLSSVNDHVRLREQTLREEIAGEVFAIFRTANYFIFGFVGLLAVRDWIVIYTAPKAALIIDTSVVQVLIGATIVQVGAAAAAIVTSLFKRKPESESDPKV